LVDLKVDDLKTEDFGSHKDVFGKVEAVVDNIVILSPIDNSMFFNPIDQRITVCDESKDKVGLVYDVFGPIDMHRYNMITDRSHVCSIRQGEVFYFNRNSFGIFPVDPNTIKEIKSDDEDEYLHD